MARYEARLDIGGEFEASFSLPLFTGDSGNSVALEFYNRGKAYDMSGAMIYARRADGTVLATSGVTAGNKAEFTLYNNMYSYPGELQVQISVIDVYGNFLTSGVLYFTVQEGFSEQSEGEGSDDFCELTSLIRQVGEGLNYIERAESAAVVIEDFFKKVPQLENQVVELVDESELDSFTSGFAIVSGSETTDSEDGPLYTEYQYPLMAESSDLFGSVTVRQVRFFKGKIEQRTVGGAWAEFSGVYRAKGSVEAYTDLPASGSCIGDVWNVKNAYKKSLSAMPVKVTEVDTGYISDGGFLILYIYDISTEIYDGSSTLTGNLYTEDGEFLSWAEVLANGVLKVSTDLADMETGSYYLELTSEDKTQYNTATVTKEYCKAGENVVWTEDGWDNLGGIYDLSVYATKEELGKVEEALSEIIAMQESLMQANV